MAQQSMLADYYGYGMQYDISDRKSMKKTKNNTYNNVSVKMESTLFLT